MNPSKISKEKAQFDIGELGFHVPFLAEGEGFEPPIGFHLCWFSRPVLSTAQPSLREHGAQRTIVRHILYSIAGKHSSSATTRRNHGRKDKTAPERKLSGAAAYTGQCR